MSPAKPSRLIVCGDVLPSVELEIQSLSEYVSVIEYVPSLSREATRERFALLVQRKPHGDTFKDILLLFNGWALRPVDQEIIQPLAPTLQVICGLWAGYNHIDLEYLTSHGIRYSNAPRAVAEPTATTATMLIMQTVRGASAAEQSVRKGAWRGDLELTPDIRDLTLGIIGLGSIGKLVKRNMEVLGMKVVYHNRSQLPPSEEGTAGYLSFDELIRTADVISVHVPYSAETHHLLSDAQFDQMKDGVFLVNTARGAVIDEEALVRAMKSHKVCRAGLDVFEHEPIVHPFLRETERATVLPHWSCAMTRTAREEQLEGISNVRAWFETGSLITPVNTIA